MCIQRTGEFKCGHVEPLPEVPTRCPEYTHRKSNTDDGKQYPDCIVWTTPIDTTDRYCRACSVVRADDSTALRTEIRDRAALDQYQRSRLSAQDAAMPQAVALPSGSDADFEALQEIMSDDAEQSYLKMKREQWEMRSRVALEERRAQQERDLEERLAREEEEERRGEGLKGEKGKRM